MFFKIKTYLDFLEEARKIHGDKYDYSLAENDYKNRTEKFALFVIRLEKTEKSTEFLSNGLVII